MKNATGTALVVISMILLVGISGGIDNLPDTITAWLAAAGLSVGAVITALVGLQMMSSME